MTFKEQEQFTKKNSDDLLSELINYQGENLISEIVRLGIQNLMELERDEHIGVGNYERGEDRRSQRKINFREVVRTDSSVETLDVTDRRFEARRVTIVKLDRFQVPLPPAFVGYDDVTNQAGPTARGLHRNGKPAGAIGGLEAVPVAPVARGVLHVIQEHEDVNRVDQIKIALPWNIVALTDGYLGRAGIPG